MKTVNHISSLWLLLPPVALFIIYAPSLGWPYFWDDLTIITDVRAHSYRNLLTEIVLGRYRPFDRGLIKAMDHLLGPQGAVFGHFFALATSTINATLLAQLGRRLCSSRVGIIAGLLFAAYPLSYQAVPQIAGLAHPMGLLLALVGTHSYLKFRHGGRWWWLVGTCLVVAVSPLTVETGVVTGILVASSEIHLCSKERPTLRNIILKPLAPITISLLGGIWLIRITGVHFSPNHLDLWKNTNYFLQGMASPVSSAARHFTEAGLTEYETVFLVSATTILLLLLPLALNAGRRHILLYSLAWVIAGSIVPWWTLPYDYVMNSPRVLYLPSVGIVLIWANLIAEAWTRIQLRWLSGGALIAILFFGVAFIRSNLRLYEIGLPPIWGLARSAAERPNDHLLVVNLPGWLSWPNLHYIIGHEGAMLMAMETSSQELARYNAFSAADVVSASFGNIMEQTPYYVGVYGESQNWEGLAMAIRSVDDVYLTNYNGDKPATLEHVGGVSTDDTNEYVANFNNRVWLTGAHATVQENIIQIELGWYLVKKTQGYDAFVHAMNCDGTVLGLKDGPALGRMYPIWQWQPGETIVDRRQIRLDPSQDASCFRLEIGLFNPETNERMRVLDSLGSEYLNHIVPVHTN